MEKTCQIAMYPDSGMENGEDFYIRPKGDRRLTAYRSTLPLLLETLIQAAKNEQSVRLDDVLIERKCIHLWLYGWPKPEFNERGMVEVQPGDTVEGVIGKIKTWYLERSEVVKKGLLESNGLTSIVEKVEIIDRPEGLEFKLYDCQLSEKRRPSVAKVMLAIASIAAIAYFSRHKISAWVGG
jgi:hypothetical protein